jgi:L-amino acid N-acyltransferase YncA
MAVLVRIARSSDAGDIAALHRHYVVTSRATFEEDPPGDTEIDERMADPLYPWLVAEEDERLVGYASTAPLRNRRAYRWSVETGIYLDPDWHGRGIGRRLLGVQLELLEQQGFVAAIAGNECRMRQASPFTRSLGSH